MYFHFNSKCFHHWSTFIFLLDKKKVLIALQFVYFHDIMKWMCFLCQFFSSTYHFFSSYCLGYLKFHKQQSPECPTLDSTTAHQNKKSKTERNRWVSSGTSDNRTYASNQWNVHFNINSSGTASILGVFQHLSMVHWIRCLFFFLFFFFFCCLKLMKTWMQSGLCYKVS